MRLGLGPRTVDLTTRALVVTPLDATRPRADLCTTARHLVAEGVDILEVWATEAGPADTAAAVRAVREVAGDDVFLGVAAARADVAAAAYAAGAVIGCDVGPADDPVFLEASAAAGAAVVVAAADAHDPRPEVVARARRAEVAGVPCDRIVVEPAHLAIERLAQIRRVAHLGHPVLVSLDGVVRHDDGQDTIVAAATIAVIAGCRLLRTADVRAARRVSDVVAAILDAR